MVTSKIIRFPQNRAYLYQISIVTVGVILSLAQFLYNRSLWVDESYLALNIIDGNVVDLLNPLDNNQVAPVLFLMIEKLFSMLIPQSEYGLRLFQLLCYWASLFFFWKILRHIFSEELVITIAVALFAFNTTMVYYSGELKQYMSDVLVVTVLLYLAIHGPNQRHRKMIVLGLSGSIAIFLSNIAPLILFSIGLYLVYPNIIRGKIVSRGQAGIFLLWILLFSIYYLLFIHNHPTREYMVSYWKYQNAFMPLDLFGKEFVYFVFQKTKMIFVELLRFSFLGILVGLLFATGIIHLVKTRKISLLILLITPFLLHTLLSGIQLYPFDARLLLYTIPLLILTVAFGVKTLIAKTHIYNKLWLQRAFAGLIPFVLLALFFKHGYPLTNQEVKSCIHYIIKHKKETDIVFVNFYALSPYLY